MAYEFHLPDIGEGLTEATVVRWLAEVGDEVGMDAPVVEMETDKAVVEIPAPRAGVVLHHGAAAGETIPVDSLLLVIGDPGEEWQPGVTSKASPVAAAPIVGTLEEATTISETAPVVSAPIAPVESPGSAQALPLVRRLAASLGVDIETVRGTGPGGRVSREDVEGAVQSGPDGDRVRMTPTRLAIARNLTRSWQEIPHVTTFGTAAAEPLLELRAGLADGETAMPLEALLMQALVPLLQRHRAFNARVDGEDIVYRSEIDIGFAVDTPQGLMVAVVRDVAGRELSEIGADVRRLAAAARDRSIGAAEMRGAGFTVSNIGAVGGGQGTPIIPYGTTSILSVGRADPRPVVRNGALAVGREFPLSLSYDHRAIDGATGRAFMLELIAAIEAPG
jgi:pyruvate dehydrogenase E2 component (dihydrolipoamide acetyltransferase)